MSSLPEQTIQELPLVASQFVLQVGPEGGTLVIGQAVVSVSPISEGEVKSRVGISWHTQLFLSPSSLKKLAQTLDKAVTDYESKIGSIATSAKDE